MRWKKEKKEILLQPKRNNKLKQNSHNVPFIFLLVGGKEQSILEEARSMKDQGTRKEVMIF